MGFVLAGRLMAEGFGRLLKKEIQQRREGQQFVLGHADIDRGRLFAEAPQVKIRVRRSSVDMRVGPQVQGLGQLAFDAAAFLAGFVLEVAEQLPGGLGQIIAV